MRMVILYFLARQETFLVLLFCLFSHGSGINPDCLLPFPRNYITYHLEKEEKIRVDGQLNEQAWEKVAWSEEFMDIQGMDWPKPRFVTRMKMRWDDEFLYIGGFIQETDVWANMTKHDSVVFKDNDFEVFIDADGSTHWYKELEINAINTTWDLELNKPYLNGGTPNSSWEMPSMKSAIYVKGPINDPSVKDSYWSVELALPLRDLALHNTVSVPPKDKDQWRINFSRVEWKVKVVDGHYVKMPNVPEDNWVWSPQHFINMHLPERWGFVQFSSAPVNESKFNPDPNWAVYSSLVMIYNAEKEYIAISGYYTANLTQLHLPDSVKAGDCHSAVQITVHQLYNFEARVKPLDNELPTGHIRDDRLIWFTEQTEGFVNT